MGIKYNPASITVDVQLAYNVKESGERWFIPGSNQGAATDTEQCQKLSPNGTERIPS